MERTIVGAQTEVKPRTMLRYKVLAGTLRFKGQRYTKNQVFDAFPEEIPAAFKRNIACVSEPTTQAIAIEQMEKALPKKENQYEIVDALAKGWFNVVNVTTKKPINEKSLRKSDAEKLRDALNV